MSFTISTRGFAELNEYLFEAAEKVDQSIARVANGVVQSTAMRAKRRILTGSRSGHIYNFDGNLHQASAPGEPPASLSGALAASITFTKITDRLTSSAAAGATSPYADTLEFGGFAPFRGKVVYVAPRPFLEPSFEEAIQAVETKLARELEKALG